MAKKATKEKPNTINIRTLPVQAHIGSLKFVNDDWSVVAFIIDRREIQNNFSDKELRYNCIYFLFGYEGQTEMCYVGQAKKRLSGESALARLREHDTSKTEPYRDVWEWAVVVTSKDDTWSLDDLNALEHAFYKEIPQDRNLNGNTPNSGGADFDKYEDKIKYIKSYVTAIGFTMFNQTEEEQAATEQIQVTSDTNEYSIVEDLQNGMARIPEIVTPQKVVKQMVDMLPAEVWNDKTVFLDPACKGGEYLKEIYDRLMNNEYMKAMYPDEFDRHDHILDEQLFGIALSQVSLERTKKKRIRNVVVIPDYISKLKSKDLGSKPDGTQLSIRDILNKEFNREMKIDVVIGNPPYQENTGGGINGGRALYNFFIDKALKITNQYVSFIIPSRWMSDKPNGLENNWLSTMRERTDIISLTDYADSTACFTGVAIAGGVCHFIIDKNYDGDADITYISQDKEICNRVGKLSTNGVVIRNQKLLGIVEKTSVDIEKSMYSIIGTNRQFSPTDNYFATNWTGFSVIKDDVNYLKYYANSRIGTDEAYVSEEDLPTGTLELAHKFKMFLPLTGPTNNQIVNIPFIGGTDSICSRTYAPMCSTEIDDNTKAENCIKYWKTRFFRALVSAIKTTQHATRLVYILVPLQDFTNNSDIDWSQSIANIDYQLCKKYGLTDEEMKYIADTIKPME